MGALDQPDVAEEAAESVLSSPYANPLFAQVAKVGLALLAVVRGDVTTANQQYHALDMAPGRGLEALGSLAYDRTMELLAQTIGELDEAAAHFEDAMGFCRKAACRPELAWTCCDYADTLRERDGDGDRARAISLLDESPAISSELGMRPLMERVLSRMEILKG